MHTKTQKITETAESKNTTIAARLRMARAKKNLTQKEAVTLLRQAGCRINERRLSTLELSGRLFAHEVFCFAEAYEIDINWFNPGIIDTSIINGSTNLESPKNRQANCQI